MFDVHFFLTFDSPALYLQQLPEFQLISRK